MILADKIVTLRKKAGWSQEELAQQLNVTRQSVSKWEGAQSIPDMEKILQMSRIFGVTIDFLLKDEMETAEAAPETETTAARRVTMEEASRYLELRRQAAPKMALATLLCVLSPAALLMLSAISQQTTRFGISEETAVGVGLCVLLVLVTAGVFLFLICAARSREFRFLEEVPFETEYGVTGMVKERRKAFQEKYGWVQILGVVLCVLSALPLFLAIMLRLSELGTMAVLCLTLLTVGCGCFALVYAGCCQNSMDKLLMEGEFERSRRGQRHLLADGDGGISDLRLRPRWKRRSRNALVDLGRGGRTLWSGHGCDSPDGQAGQIKRHTPPCLSGARGFSEKDCGGKHEIKI